MGTRYRNSRGWLRTLIIDDDDAIRRIFDQYEVIILLVAIGFIREELWSGQYIFSIA